MAHHNGPKNSHAGRLLLQPHRWLLLLPACLLFTGPAMPGQQQPQFSVKVKVVNVLATVRDKHGEIIRDLTKDDFVLQEDGRPQEIHYFTHETDLPLTLGLLVDTSYSQRRLLDKERSASYAFLDKVLREDRDLAFLIRFDFDVELLEDLTSSRQKLQSALGTLQIPQMQQANQGGGSPWPGPGPRRGGGSGGGRGGGGGGTLLYDAVFLAADELMSKQAGRKALILLTDGVDQGSKLSLEKAAEAAQRADTVVYSILFADEAFYRGIGGWSGPPSGRHGGWGGPRFPPQQQEHPNGKKVLEKISRETGGRMFEVSKKHPIEQIYAQIEEELRAQYSLGYTPDKSKAGPGYHKIHLETKQKNLIVQTREGYYAEQ